MEINMRDLWVVTSYFNPSQYRSKARNYARFMDGMREANVPVRTIECCFGYQPFALPSSDSVFQVRSRDILWQKERLLNLLLPQLPGECTKIAWIDADVVFENPAWAVETSRALDSFAVVQPYGTVVRLPQGHDEDRGEGDRWESFCAMCSRQPGLMRAGNFHYHGHTGFAWAARRDLLQRHGFYDVCMTGSGDHLMAHGFCGDWTSECLNKMMGSNLRYRAHFHRWARGISENVRNRISYVPGKLLHLWHGELEERRYHENNLALQSFNFDPEVDLRMAKNGCWEWSDPQRGLREWAINLFNSRNEDGAMPVSSTSSTQNA